MIYNCKCRLLKNLSKIICFDFFAIFILKNPYNTYKISRFLICSPVVLGVISFIIIILKKLFQPFTLFNLKTNRTKMSTVIQ